MRRCLPLAVFVGVTLGAGGRVFDRSRRDVGRRRRLDDPQFERGAVEQRRGVGVIVNAEAAILSDERQRVQHPVRRGVGVLIDGGLRGGQALENAGLGLLDEALHVVAAEVGVTARTRVRLTVRRLTGEDRLHGVAARIPRRAGLDGQRHVTVGAFRAFGEVLGGHARNLIDDLLALEHGLDRVVHLLQAVVGVAAYAQVVRLLREFVIVRFAVHGSGTRYRSRRTAPSPTSPGRALRRRGRRRSSR